MKPQRTLTDADVEAIADALQVRIKEEFYHDLGAGVWSLAWKAAVGIIVAIAYYGWAHK